MLEPGSPCLLLVTSFLFPDFLPSWRNPFYWATVSLISISLPSLYLSSPSSRRSLSLGLSISQYSIRETETAELFWAERNLIQGFIYKIFRRAEKYKKKVSDTQMSVTAGSLCFHYRLQELACQITLRILLWLRRPQVHIRVNANTSSRISINLPQAFWCHATAYYHMAIQLSDKVTNSSPYDKYFSGFGIPGKLQSQANCDYWYLTGKRI